jgi:protease-4
MNKTNYQSFVPRYSADKISFRTMSVTLWSAFMALVQTVGPVSAAPGDQPAEEKSKNIIAVFRLNGPLAEAPVEDAFPFFSGPWTSLKELVERIAKAADDPNVKAVVLLPESASMGSAQVEELRAAIALVRSEGKEVYVHADSLMMGQYVLACGASRISVVPTGPVIIPGLHGSSLHVRGLLDKIGVKPDFVTEGAYKSAAELFMREQPSPEADEMMNWLMDSSYASFKDLIAQGRKADAAKVQRWVDSGLFSTDQAKASGLIDAVEQKADFEAVLKEKYGEDIVFSKKYGRKNQPDVDFSSPFAFLKIWGDLFRGPQKKTGAKPAVGIVYVNGPIMTGRSTPNPFGGGMGAFSTEVSASLDKAAADDSIKAVVLRIDSPGGSATASEIILDATKRLKAKKPFVVSMGDVAGSGGYYVACAADTIFADATTLTGSIGVLGGKLATTEMWKKIGITFKEYKRGQNAGMFSTDDVFTESERARMRGFMDEIYAAFKKHVTDIRGSRLKKPIDDLAGGRVYTGKQALDLGLVDKLGTMRDAIAFAADQAKIKSYDVRVVPESKNFLEQLMEGISDGKDDPSHIGITAGEGSLLKLAAPYLQNLDPQRTAAVLSVLTRLEILQKEGVVLTMPEILAQ